MWLDVFGLAKEFEIGTYGSLKGGDNIGDELDAHELLQNAWLEHNANVTRGVGRESLDNPAIALGKNQCIIGLIDYNKDITYMIKILY